MNRRQTVIPDLLLILTGALLGFVTNYATNTTGPTPRLLREVQRWSILIVGGLIVMLIAIRLWQYRIEQTPDRPLWDREMPPYPGLDSFTEDEAAVYFGREEEITLLLDRLRCSAEDMTAHAIPLIGPSGSGKTSLIHAGLLNRLSKSHGRWFVLSTMTPQIAPLPALARSLAPAIGRRSADDVAERLDGGDDALAVLLQELQTELPRRTASVLLVVDQAEELFTQVSAESRDRFLRVIDTALRRFPGLRVIFALRSEFLGDFLQHEHAALFRQPITVGVFARSRLFDVIEGPAAAAGLRFDPPSLVGRMVDDTGGGEALPLLAYTLHELWSRAGSRRVMTERDYDAIGGVNGALTKRANEVRERLRDEDAQHDLVLRTLLRFVTMNGATPTRRRVPLRRLDERERHVVQSFVWARLLSVDTDPATCEPSAQVTHEALLVHWPPLRRMIEARQADLRLRRRLEEWAEEWSAGGRHDDYLLSGERLRAVLRWSETSADELKDLPAVAELVERSRRADLATMRRLSDATAGRALECMSRDPELALRCALEALRVYTPTQLLHQVLVASLAVCQLRVVLRGHDGPVLGVASSPDGTRIATCGQDATVLIWSTRDHGRLAALTGHRGAVTAVAWSPDGTRLATASADRTIRLWDAEDHHQIGELNGHTDTVTAVAWSPGGTRLATASADGTAAVWSTRSHERIAVLAGHTGDVTAVAWSPDGTRLATASADRTARIWNVGDDLSSATLSGHTNAVTAVAWSPDGARLATASNDWSVRLWDPGDRDEIGKLTGHDDAVLDLAWSPAADRLATCGADRTVMLWDVAAGDCVCVLGGPDGPVTGAAWTGTDAEAVTLATSSLDGTARLWNGNLTTFRHEGRTRALAWSPDGRRLASASSDRVVRVWRTAQGVAEQSLVGHTDKVNHLAWTPDGKRLATTGWDQTVRIWGLRDGSALTEQVLIGHSEQGTWVAWSPDGKHLASASLDRTVRIWDGDDPSRCSVMEFGSGVTWVAWSPQGDRLAVALWDHTVLVYGADDMQGDPILLAGHDEDIWGASWSPDGGRLATASFDRTIRVWDTATGEQVTVLRGHEDAVFGVAWSPVDGGWLASVGRDRSVRLWDVPRQREVTTLHGHHDVVWGLAWSPDGSRLATSSDEGTIRLWDVTMSIEAAVDRARRLGLREPTGDERARFLLPGAGG